MGLTIHYNLSLDGGLSAKKVKEKLNILRQACLDLPFKEVGLITDLKGQNADPDTTEDADVEWFLIQCMHHTYYKIIDNKPVITDDFSSGGFYSTGIAPKRVIGFKTTVGKGCEQANIGMRLLPKEHKVSYEKEDGTEGHAVISIPEGHKWTWRSFCKTQFALEISIENFVQCHLTVIKMLDKAKELGFEVEVSDEGDYWEKRDLSLLIKNVGANAAAIAAIAGGFKDCGLPVMSPIFGNKNFEQLEHRGSEQFKDVTSQILEVLGRKKQEK